MLRAMAMVAAVAGLTACGQVKTAETTLADGPATQIDTAVVLPLLTTYCGRCHVDTSRHAFKLGADEAANAANVTANKDLIVARLTRKFADASAPRSMPPPGREAVGTEPAVAPSPEFTQLLAKPVDYRNLVVGLIGADAYKSQAVLGDVKSSCGSCHASPSQAEHDLQFFPPGASTEEITTRLFSKQAEIFAAVSEGRMPPAQSSVLPSWQRNPEAKLQVLALFAPEPVQQEQPDHP